MNIGSTIESTGPYHRHGRELMDGWTLSVRVIHVRSPALVQGGASHSLSLSRSISQ